MAGRTHFYDTILRKDPETGLAEPLDDIAVTIEKIMEDGNPDPIPPIPYTGRKSHSVQTDLQTDDEGEIDFWLDAGDYNIGFSDTHTPPRMQPKTVGWSSTPGAPNGLLRSQLPEYGHGLAYPGDIKMSGIEKDHPNAQTFTGVPKLRYPYEEVGWLLCDGRSLVASAYPLLFDAIGYKWGGSGATFNIPDLRDASPMGPGNMGTGRADRNVITDDTALGKTLGVPTTSITEDFMPAHGHTLSITTATVTIEAVGNHSHGGATAAMNRNESHYHKPHATAVLEGSEILHTGNTWDRTHHVLGTGEGGFGDPHTVRGAEVTKTFRSIDGTGGTDINHEHGITPDGGHNHAGSSISVGGTVVDAPAQGTALKTMTNIHPCTVVNFFIKCR